MKERFLAELGQRLHHATRGAEQFTALIGDDDVRPPAGGEMPLDLIGEVVNVHDRALDPLLRQAVEGIVDQSFAADLYERLGYLAVVRPHARAEPGREHHRASRCGYRGRLFDHA